MERVNTSSVRGFLRSCDDLTEKIRCLIQKKLIKKYLSRYKNFICGLKNRIKNSHFYNKSISLSLWTTNPMHAKLSFGITNHYQHIFDKRVPNGTYFERSKVHFVHKKELSLNLTKAMDVR